MSTPGDVYEELDTLARGVGARVGTRNHRHPAVQGAFTRVCRFKFAGRRVACSTNGSVLLMEVEASSSIVLAAGRPDLVLQARKRFADVGSVPVFEAARGGGEALRAWLNVPSHRRALAALALTEDEQLLVATNRTALIIWPAGVDRDQARLAALCAVVSLLPAEPSPPSPLPAGLQPLQPLLPLWAIDDDEERASVVEQASEAELEALWTSVEPWLATIDGVLDVDEAQCASLTSLAQAALEARIELGSRRAERRGCRG